MTIEEIKEKLNRDDRFCRYNEMRIDVIRPGYAEAVMEITENKLNGLGIAQGGAIFTLADFASAVAANYGLTDTTVISLHSDITFLAAAKGEKLLAEATRVRHGRTVTLYEVTVTDELGTLVARVGMNGYTVKR